MPLFLLFCASCGRELDFWLATQRRRETFERPCPSCPGRVFQIVLPKEAA